MSDKRLLKIRFCSIINNIRKPGSMSIYLAYLLG